MNPVPSLCVPNRPQGYIFKWVRILRYICLAGEVRATDEANHALPRGRRVRPHKGRTVEPGVEREGPGERQIVSPSSRKKGRGWRPQEVT